MLKAVFFDFNGVLVDDERIHLELFQELLAEAGVRISEEEYFGRYFGCSDRDLFRLLLSRNGRPPKDARVDALIRRKHRRYLEVIGDRSILVPGAREVVETFATAYPVGIVSGALRAEVEAVLAREGMADDVRIVVAAEDVARGKPDPEGFVLALNRVNQLVDLAVFPVNPSECLVIEDGPAGIAAARSLGMRCVAVAATVPREQLVEADLVYDSLDQIRMDRIQTLFGEPPDSA